MSARNHRYQSIHSNATTDKPDKENPVRMIIDCHAGFVYIDPLVQRCRAGRKEKHKKGDIPAATCVRLCVTATRRMFLNDTNDESIVATWMSAGFEQGRRLRKCLFYESSLL